VLFSRISSAAKNSLPGLEKRIDRELVSFGKAGAFLRLAGRSPKDSVLRETREDYEKLAKALNDPYAATMEMRRRAMHVLSARDAMWMILTSERVYADCLDFSEYGEPEQIVLREWIEEMHMRDEYRVFVKDGRMISISQYDHYGFYSIDRARVQAAIETAMTRLDLGVPSFCADFLCVPNQRALLIEVSPFRDCTGAAFFTWAELHAWLPTRPFEFRVTTAPRANMDALLEAWVAANFDDARTKSLPPYFALGRIDRWRLASRVPPPAPKNKLMFFYGTLKRAFHWCSKYLTPHVAEFVGKARTVRAARLVVGESGVPYCFFDCGSAVTDAMRVRGELWKVNEEGLQGLDEYEGVGKGHYARRLIEVDDESKSSHDNDNDDDDNDGADSPRVRAYVYEPSAAFGAKLGAALGGLKSIEEYTLDTHKQLYRPIAHIEVKQALYLSEISAADN
jgi:gamma-glutamylcyclotransferase (GGCT)/AIG2-like uncharacterized protein YtfP